MYRNAPRRRRHGKVFLAEDIILGRKVALKFPSDSLKQDPVAARRFLNEAKAAATLNDPFVCKVHEIAEAGGESFIVMEYLPGETLKKRLNRGPVPRLIGT